MKVIYAQKPKGNLLKKLKKHIKVYLIKKIISKILMLKNKKYPKT